MKSEGHPQYFQASVTCVGCGNTFTCGSTLPEIRVNICSACHPHYTGKSKVLDTEGRVDRFKRKYAKFGAGAGAAAATTEKTPAA